MCACVCMRACVSGKFRFHIDVFIHAHLLMRACGFFSNEEKTTQKKRQRMKNRKRKKKEGRGKRFGKVY